MNTIQKRFGARVRQLREESGESQEDFAHRTGMGRSFVGRVERGEQDCCLGSVEKFAKGLGVPIGDLFQFDKLPRKRA